jgi:hypothetical protein
MKPTLAAAIIFALTPIALAAQSSMPGMSMPAKPPVAPSTSLTITFNGSTTTFSIADLKALPQQTITAVDGHTGKTVTFTGPLATDVLAKAGLIPGEKTHALILHSYVTATGTDGYFVIYSAAELEPMFTSGKVIVALTADGSPDTSGLQLVNPLDVKPARWVHGLASINVTTTTAPTK